VVNLLKTILNFCSWLFFVAIIVLGIYILASNSYLFGGYRSFVVLSGSMEPSIKIGDIILVHRQATYLPHDIITFQQENHLVTHRIVSTRFDRDEQLFVTQGDANRSEDDGQVNLKHVVGRVVLTIPYLGRFVAFAQSPLGLTSLVIVPILGFLVDLFFKPQNA